MLVWSTIEASCPMCGQRLRVRDVGGGFAAGQDSDLLVRMHGKHVIQAQIHTCGECRFSGYAQDFLDRSISDATVERYFREFADELVSDTVHVAAEPRRGRSSDEHARRGGADGRQDRGAGNVRRRKSNRRGKRDHDAENTTGSVDGHGVAPRTPLPHLQYYWSAQLGPLLGLSARETGLRTLRAYWCLRLAPSTRLEPELIARLSKLYLRRAIAHLRKSLREDPDRAVLYLVGELCRRNGSFLRSRSYFERFLAGQGSGPEPHEYLRRAACRLLDAAAHDDASDKTMEELLYPSAPRKRSTKSSDPAKRMRATDRSAGRDGEDSNGADSNGADSNGADSNGADSNEPRRGRRSGGGRRGGGRRGGGRSDGGRDGDG